MTNVSHFQHMGNPTGKGPQYEKVSPRQPLTGFDISTWEDAEDEHAQIKTAAVLTVLGEPSAVATNGSGLPTPPKPAETGISTE